MRDFLALPLLNVSVPPPRKKGGKKGGGERRPVLYPSPPIHAADMDKAAGAVGVEGAGGGGGGGGGRGEGGVVRGSDTETRLNREFTEMGGQKEFMAVVPPVPREFELVVHKFSKVMLF